MTRKMTFSENVQSSTQLSHRRKQVKGLSNKLRHSEVMRALIWCSQTCCWPH
jgi:hypothetical protein